MGMPAMTALTAIPRAETDPAAQHIPDRHTWSEGEGTAGDCFDRMVVQAPPASTACLQPALYERQSR